MAPVGSGSRDPDVGHFKEGIHAKFEKGPNAFVGSIEAAPLTRDAQFKAMSIEFGRQYKDGKSNNPRGVSLETQAALILFLLCAEPKTLLGRNTRSG